MVGHGVTNTGRSLLANITRSRSKVRTRHQRGSHEPCWSSRVCLLNLMSSSPPIVCNPPWQSNLEAYYESQLSRLAANFAICSDFSLTLGGKIKFAESLSGRYADVVSKQHPRHLSLIHSLVRS